MTIMEGEMEIIEEGGERFVDEWKVDSSSDCHIACERFSHEQHDFLD